MVRNIITDLCHHLEIGIDGNLDIGNKRVIVGTPTITLTDNILTISCDTAGASIYYTLDGSTPTSASTRYTTAVTLNNSCTIKAIAIKGSKSSIVVSQDYVAILTAWRLAGNSSVHTDPYLTQWKVSGNSVVDNNAILSCGDLGQDGKYHVKISNGVNIYDIPLTEPLRKVNDVADTIEFPSETEGKALVTRNLGSIIMGKKNFSVRDTKYADYKRFMFMSGAKPVSNNNVVANGLCSGYNMITNNQTYNINADGTGTAGIGIDTGGNGYVFDPNYNTASDANAIKTANANTEFIYELATPTTELVDAPQIAVSPTDTYTSANVTPYSAFEHTKHSEIWSCGEYSAVDGKYHILVQPQGGSIADIALDEPLRKVNDVADTIEFPSGTEGKALVTRNIMSGILGEYTWNRSNNRLRTTDVVGTIVAPSSNSVAADIICATYPTLSTNQSSLEQDSNIAVATSGNLFLYDTEYPNITTAAIRNQLIAKIQNMEIIFRLATPTTELVDAPQIEEAESYTCVISQGAKAVSWSSFETE